MTLCPERLAEIALYYALAALVWFCLSVFSMGLVEDREPSVSKDRLDQIGIVGMVAALGAILLPAGGLVDSVGTMVLVVLVLALLFSVLTVLTWRTCVHGVIRRHVRSLEAPRDPILLGEVEAQNESIMKRVRWGRHMLTAGAVVMVGALGFALFYGRCVDDPRVLNGETVTGVATPASRDPVDLDAPEVDPPLAEPSDQPGDQGTVPPVNVGANPP